ncbi:MAG: glycogen-binding domain-containing protein, partial [Promethearchaeia archaeon]
DWSAWLEQHEMQRQADGTYSVQVPLPRGRTVRFKFMVNGIWTLSTPCGRSWPFALSATGPLPCLQPTLTPLLSLS